MNEYTRLIESGQTVNAGSGQNPYLDLMQQEEAQSNTALRATALGTLDTNPDEAARQLRIAKLLDTPVAAVRALPEDAAQAVKLRELETNTARAPKLRQAYADEEFSRLAHDDSHTLGKIESLSNKSIATSFADSPMAFARQLGASFNKGARSLNTVLGAFPVAYDKLAGGTAAQDAWFGHMVAPLERDAQALELDKNARFPEKLAGTLGSLTGMLSQITLTSASSGATASGSVAQAVGQAAEHGFKSMAFPALTEAVDTGRRVYDATGDGNAAVKAAQMAYLTTSAMGVIPLSAPGGIGTRLATGAVSGIASGEASREAMNWALPDNMQTPFEVENAILSGVAGSILAVGGPRAFDSSYDLIRKTYSDALKAQQAEQVHQKFTELNLLYTDAKLRTRASDEFKGYIKSVSDKVPDVYFNGEVFAQEMHKAGITPEQLKSVMPEVAGRLHEALQTQGDVRIPTEDYATHIAPGKLGEALLPHVKIDPDPDVMTKADSEAYYKNEVQQMTDEAGKAVKTLSENAVFNKSKKAVSDDVLTQLNAAGRASNEVNKVNAQVYSDMIGALAPEYGMTPEAFHAQHGQRIIGEGAGGFEQSAKPFDGQETAATPLKDGTTHIEVDGVQRHALNSNGKPIHPTEEGVRNFNRWFGDSKAVDDQGRPLVAYRGEAHGEEFNDYTKHRTRENAIFLTPDRDIASIYEKGNQPREFYVKASSILDLTNDTPKTRKFITEWANNFDEWVDRQSGEEIDPVDAVQAGNLFDYEGDWSGERWKSLQLEALDNHDAAYLPDWDSTKGMFPALVIKDGMQLKSATGNRGTFDPNDTNITYSRKQNRSDLPEVTESLVQSVIDRIPVIRQAASDAHITTLFSPGELPAQVLEKAQAEGIESSEIHGVLYKGKVYIVRQNLKSEQDVEEVLLHEVIGHGGTRALLGESHGTVLLESFNRAGGINGLRKIADTFGVRDQLEAYIPKGELSDNQKVQLVDELLAQASGKPTGKLKAALLEWWNTMRNHLVDALDKMGFTKTAEKLDKFDASEAAVMLRQMYEAVHDGGSIDGQGVAFMTARHDNKAAEDAGFETSKIWLHGTTKDVKSFKVSQDGVNELGAGVYLSTSPTETFFHSRGEGGRTIQTFIRKGDLFDLSILHDTGQEIGGHAEKQAEAYNEIARRIQANQDGLSATMKGWAKEPVADFAAYIKGTGRDNLNAWLKLAGYIGATDKFSQYPNQVVVFDPKNIRSVNAKFDPKKADSANLLHQAAQVEIISKASPEREAKTLEEAKGMAREFVGKSLHNESTGLDATVSNNNLGKMTSSKAVTKSTNALDHALAVANIDKLFKNAILDNSHPDSKGEPTIAAIHRYVAPMVAADGSVVAVKMTVKETTGKNEPNPLYTIETLDVEKPTLRAPDESGIERGIDTKGVATSTTGGLGDNILQSIAAVKDALHQNTVNLFSLLTH